MQIQPEQALFLLNTLLPTLEREHQTTVNVLEAVPADKADYKPETNAWSAFDLCWHIASAESTFLAAVATGAFDFTPREKVKSMAEVVTFYKETFAKNLSALKSLTGEQAAQIVDFRGMMQLPAVAFITFSMHHIVHHRGQLSVYLRPMGGKVPAIYGESFDSKAARTTAQGS
jgi:uncharacterized damage-inducible protein DinB